MDTPLEHKAFLLLLAVVTVAFVWILIPFYGAVFWAVILAIVFNPMQRSFERRLRPRSNLAAVLSVIVVIVIAIIPLIVIFSSVVSEGAQLVRKVQEGQFELPGSLNDLRDMLPTWARSGLEQAGLNDFSALQQRLISFFAQAGQFLAGRAVAIGQNTLRFIGAIGIMLYVLFFLFRDGRQIGRDILKAMPLSEEKSRALLIRFAAVVRATVKGNIIIAIIQGTIGGVTLWLLGIEGALLWGTLMTFLSMLPAVGSALVWVPMAASLLLGGAVAKGVILIVIGVFVIGLVDNLLRPKLVGADTRLPDYVILVSTVGGLSVFGINGFVIGPLIAALFLSFWSLYRDERNSVREAQISPEP